MPGFATTDLVLPCSPEWRREALGVLYRRVDVGFRDQVIEEALAGVNGGVIDLSGLWVARRRGQMVGALLTQTLAGRAAAVWAPEVFEGWGRAATARRLIVDAMASLRAHGLILAQALVDESASPRASADLTRGGLTKITVLDYLERDTAGPIDDVPTGVAMTWRPFGSETEAEFRAVLESTYTGSLDMPELDGVRSLDDVIAGHRAAGRFDPSRWLVGRVDGEPESAAVVLLSELPDRDAWEVAYLGLTPAARGRGLGRLVLDHARSVAARQTHRLELAVDRRNTPAVRLYRDAGFRTFDRRAVHLTILR